MNEEGTVVVSGAGTGIGKAVTDRLVAEGRGVIAVGRRRTILQQLVSDLGGHVEMVVADLAIESGAQSVADVVRARGGRCAG